MSRRPLSQFADRDDLLSEEAQYVLREAKEWCNSLLSLVENKVPDKATVEQMVQCISALEKKTTELATACAVWETQSNTFQELYDISSSLASKVDSLQAAVLALSDKLDNEDVLNLDTDYVDTVTNIL